ncbi:hypothetical protein FSST1_011361 [Fusarium sambucinum]
MTCPDTPPAIQRYLQIFNPAPETTCTNFHQFSRFPSEIRCLIWEQALSHERWIRVALVPPQKLWGMVPSSQIPRKNGIFVYHKHLKISKLFRISHESRLVALSFYRVQLPCLYWKGGPTHQKEVEGNKATLYICPELDTLELETLRGFHHFAHEIWTSDRLRIGLVNLATCGVNPRPYMDWTLDGRDEALLNQALLRIERFTVLNRGSNNKWLRDGRRDPIASLYSPEHRSCPVFGDTIGFERLSYDPRICEEHLKQISTGPKDPRMEFHGWFSVLDQLGIKHDHKVDYRYGMCHEDYSSKGRFGQDRDAAAEWVRKDEESFQSNMKEKCNTKGLKYPPPESQSLEQVPQQAIGFWLFPLESLEPLADPKIRFRSYVGQETWEHFSHTRVLDMTKHKPELCLSIMH